jgi:hypothetical protein
MVMKSLYCISLVCTGLFLASCAEISSEHAVNNTEGPQIKKSIPAILPTCKPKKDPLAVAFYFRSKPLPLPYVVLGQEKVSRYNYFGLKRQAANIHDKMRTLAANMGGDAIININNTDKSVVGTVIAYRLTSSIHTIGAPEWQQG